MSIELVVRRVGELETLLLHGFDVRRRGLAESARAIPFLPTSLVQRLVDISRIRNRQVHPRPGSRAMDDTEVADFEAKADSAAEELTALRKLRALSGLVVSFNSKAFDRALTSGQGSSYPQEIFCSNDNPEQMASLWKIHHNSSSECIISSVGNGYCLDEFGHDTGWKIHLWPYHGLPNQCWKIELLEDHSYRIVSLESGQCLDAWEGEEGIHVHCQEWHGGENQRWWLNPVFG